MLKYSVIVPVYNVEKYLEKCIKSIACQDFGGEYEIVIVDDGSTDGSGKLCDEIKENIPQKNIRVIHQANKGLGGARNTGIQNAEGEYFIFVDSDDAITPDALSLIDAYIEEHKVKMLFFDYETVDENGNVLEYVDAHNAEIAPSFLADSPDLLFMANSACNKVFHRSLFDDTQVLFPDRAWFEDLSTVVKLYPVAGKIGYLKKALYLYFQRSGSIMTNKNIERNREIIDAVDSLIEFYKEKGIYEKYSAELEYLALLHIYVLASVRVVKADRKAPVLKEFRNYILQNFPNFKNNKYYGAMSKKEKLIIKLVDGDNYFLLKLMLDINSRLRG